jgi:lysophospholipase L1-like esterase
MSPMPRRAIVAACAVVVAVALGAAPLAQPRGERWVVTWATATVGRPQTPPPTATGAAPTPYRHLSNQTVREIVHATVAGSRVRVTVTNAFGTAPLAIGAAHIALRDTGSTIAAASDRALTFNGRVAIAIPPGAALMSDPAALAVPAGADLAIDLYLPDTTDTPSPLTMHAAAHQTSYVSEPGNHAGADALPVAATTESWFALAHVDVAPAAAVDAIVAFGDSITDGSASTTDANGRWPDVLARRLAAKKAALTVVNAGIGGNRLLTNAAPQAGVNALARFERDVLDLPGVRHVIVLEGINDIGNARDNPLPSADELIAAHAQLVARAHDRGLHIVGATLTPFEGANYYTEVGEAKRQALNAWIRSGRAYDAFIDLDAATRDPARPGRFLPAYDSGDHLHPNDAGYKAIGEAIDLALFADGRRGSRTKD